MLKRSYHALFQQKIATKINLLAAVLPTPVALLGLWLKRGTTMHTLTFIKSHK